MPSEKSYLTRVQNKTALWTPQSKKQWQALLSRADEIFYGGAAGGGKTDLVLGIAIECHQHSAIFRRVYPNLKEIIRRARVIIGDNAKENRADKLWTWDDGRTLEFGAVQYEDNKTDWQGRPHDLKAFDELPEFTESQYEFICGWNRSTDKNQRVRVVATGNPPMNEAGSWILRRWGAWLDDKHPNPAEPGELRYYATIDGEEIEYKTGDAFEHDGELIQPRSRTFIPALLEDNPFYAEDARYKSVLQSLPEPLRSQLLYGDFKASAELDPFQVIPTDWVRLAQDRWLEIEHPETPLSAVGIDPARGGRDNMSMAKRYDNYYAELIYWPGVAVRDGAIAADLIMNDLSNENPAIMNIDVIGIGSSAFDHLKPHYPQIIPINASGKSEYRDRSGKYKMRNTRAEYYWRMRDALDPEFGDDVALPPGNEIVADLCSARYTPSSAGIIIEEKVDIKKRLGRSPDKGEAILLANMIGYVPLPEDQVEQESKWSEGDRTGWAKRY